MPEFGSTAIDMMVQGIHASVMENFQVAYPFQKSAGRRHSMLKKQPMFPTKWLLPYVVEIYPDKDGKVHMATIETVKEMYDVQY